MTKARPKTSGESIVTRRFKGAPNLGSYADRQDDHFASLFKGDYAAARKEAEKEVDAQLAAAASGGIGGRNKKKKTIGGFY